MTKYVYLICLLTALGGLSVVDAYWRLVIWRNPRRALTLIFAGVAFFVLWDICGIHLHIFQVGTGRILTGVRLAPQLPLEEPIFLTLLMYQTLLLWEILRGRHER